MQRTATEGSDLKFQMRLALDDAKHLHLIGREEEEEEEDRRRPTDPSLSFLPFFLPPLYSQQRWQGERDEM
jgi:hypothetical protein